MVCFAYISTSVPFSRTRLARSMGGVGPVVVIIMMTCLFTVTGECLDHGTDLLCSEGSTPESESKAVDLTHYNMIELKGACNFKIIRSWATVLVKSQTLVCEACDAKFEKFRWLVCIHYEVVEVVSTTTIPGHQAYQTLRNPTAQPSSSWEWHHYLTYVGYGGLAFLCLFTLAFTVATINHLWVRKCQPGPCPCYLPVDKLVAAATTIKAKFFGKSEPKALEAPAAPYLVLMDV